VIRVITCAFFCLLITSNLSAQQIQVSAISYDNLTENTIRFVYQANTGGCFFVKFRIKPQEPSSVYPYQSQDYCNFGNPSLTSIAIGGLSPGKVYQFIPTARPNAGNLSGICETETCGALVQEVTMPSTLNTEPKGPEVYIPAEPDTTNYTIIPIRQDPATQKCVAASAVPSLNIAANEPLGDIINAKLKYGVVVEFEQGIECKVNEAPPKHVVNAGYSLLELPIDPQAGGDLDSPSHRWVVFRTKELTAADFPPYGSRISPNFGSKDARYASDLNGDASFFKAEKKLARLIATVPQGNFNGEIFNLDVGCHHIWFQKMEWTVDSSPYPSGTTVAPMYQWLFALANYNTNKPHKYIVLDRLYAHGAPQPVNTYGFAQIRNASNVAVIGNWVEDIENGGPGRQPTTGICAGQGTAVITLCEMKWANNGNDAPVGMLGNATAFLSGATGSAAYRIALTGIGVKIYHTSNGTVSCANCEAIRVQNFDRPGSIPWEEFVWQFGNINGNQWDWPGTVSQGFTFGVVTETEIGGRINVSNNMFKGVMMTFYGENKMGVKAHDNYVFDRNYFVYPKSRRRNSGVWNGRNYTARQIWEIKTGRQYRIRGNVFEGYWGQFNEGPAIFLSNRASEPVQDGRGGISDILIQSNIIRHGSHGISCQGTAQTPYDSSNAVTRVLIDNNLVYDLNRFKYQNGSYGPGLQANYMSFVPGCSNVTITHNTFGPILGRHPGMFFVGGGGALAGGLKVTDNFFHMSRGIVGSMVAIDDTNYQAASNLRRIPGFTGSNPGFKSIMDQFFVRLESSTVPYYVFSNNVMVGDRSSNQEDGSDTRDLTQEEVSSFASPTNIPSGNFFPSGSTTLARSQQAGFKNAAAFDFRLVPGSLYTANGANPGSDNRDIGTDFQKLILHQGRVTNITTSPGSDRIDVNFNVDPEQVCAVDLKTETGSWTRQWNDQQLPFRTVSFSGLSSNTMYVYRILCAYEQFDEDDTYSNYESGEQTRGKVRTGDTVAGIETQRLRIDPIPSLGFRKVQVEYATSSGPTTMTQPIFCEQGCTVSIPWQRSILLSTRIHYQDSNDTVVRVGPWERRILN
jgi:hypothetical protein